ncbi:MAG: hypothetical protein WC374_01235 [Phycisphaerae bacterium]|jgi:hypothetical protein
MFLRLALLVLLMAAGCRMEQPEQQASDIEFSSYEETKVVIKGGNAFPSYLAGTWIDQNRQWQFTFQPDGKISDIVHSMGHVKLEPGKTTTFPMRIDGTNIYKPGQWIVVYDTVNQELTVQIALDYMYAEVGGGIIEGSSLDIFSGPVSDDGKVWQVNWVGYPQYTAHTEKHPNFSLGGDEVPHRQKSLIFKKVRQQGENLGTQQ